MHINSISKIDSDRLSTYIFIIVFFLMNVLDRGAYAFENLDGVALILNQFGRSVLVTIFDLTLDQKESGRNYRTVINEVTKLTLDHK